MYQQIRLLAPLCIRGITGGIIILFTQITLCLNSKIVGLLAKNEYPLIMKSKNFYKAFKKPKLK